MSFQLNHIFLYTNRSIKNFTKSAETVNLSDPLNLAFPLLDLVQSPPHPRGASSLRVHDRRHLFQSGPVSCPAVNMKEVSIGQIQRVPIQWRAQECEESLTFFCIASTSESSLFSVVYVSLIAGVSQSTSEYDGNLIVGFEFIYYPHLLHIPH
jgi:hypothetical protein